MPIDTLTPRRLVFGSDDTAEVEPGSPQHALLMDGKERGPAICGARPGKKTAWSMYAGISVTCEQCQRLLAGERP